MNMLTRLVNRLKSQYYTWDDKDVVFIVSTGRTATKFFSGFFDRNFDTMLARHEPAPDLFDLGTGFIRGTYSGAAVNASLKYARYDIYKALEKDNVATYVESNNNAALLLPVVKEVFPNLKVAFITRDPRSYLISSYSKVHGIKNNAQNTGYTLYGDRDPRNRLTAKDFAGDALGPSWDGLRRFEKLCWHWKTYNRLIQDFIEDSAADPRAHIVLKYEDLFKKGDVTAVRGLIDFAGVDRMLQPSDSQLNDLLSRKSNESTAYQLLPFDQWEEQDKQSFDDILGKEIVRYGYS